LLINAEQPATAIPFLEKSNKLMSNNSEVLRNLGYAYAISGKYEKGIYILKRAQFLNPDDSLIKEDLAMALIGSGEVLE
jgi:Flp pilus assembly protein TadD